MKRKGLWLVTALLALLSLALAAPALAADEVGVVVTADPAELSESGPVLLTFEVSNHSDFELHEITIGLDNAIFTIEGMEDCVIPPGGSATFPLLYEVPDSRIGLELLFQVNWLQYGEPHTLEVPVTIARAIEPVISIQRTVSSAYAKQGDTITLTYELSNDTKFDMTNITVIDEQISDNPIFRNHTLNAGGTLTQSFVYTMGTEDVVSAPIVTYEVNGKTKTFSAIDPVTLSMVNVQIDLRVEMGTPTAAGVPFTITAVNNGNQTVNEIQITDELSNPVHGDPFSLSPGEERTLSYLVVPVATEPVRNVAFRLTGEDALGGRYEPTYETTYEVHPFVDDSQLDVVLLPEILEPWTAQTGAVRVRVTIRNGSAVELTDAVLMESTLGDLATYERLAAGDTIFEESLVIGSPRNLTFSIKGTDPAGTERQLTSAMLTVAYPTVTETPLPSPTPTIEQSGGLVSGLNATLSTVLIGIGAILLLCFVALVVLAVLEHRKTGGLALEDGDEDEDEPVDESIDLAFEEEPPEPLRLSSARGPEDYVRIADERRRHYTPTRRPLMPTVVPEFDDGIAHNTEETVVLQRHSAQFTRPQQTTDRPFDAAKPHWKQTATPQAPVQPVQPVQPVPPTTSAPQRPYATPQAPVQPVQPVQPEPPATSAPQRPYATPQAPVQPVQPAQPVPPAASASQRPYATPQAPVQGTAPGTPAAHVIDMAQAAPVAAWLTGEASPEQAGAPADRTPKRLSFRPEPAVRMKQRETVRHMPRQDGEGGNK